MQSETKNSASPAVIARVVAVVAIGLILILTLAKASGNIIEDIYADSTKREVAQLAQKGCKLKSETLSPYKALIYVCPDGSNTKVFSH